MTTLRVPVVAESDVTKQVKDYLVAHGWRSLRQQRTVMPGTFQTGEPGIADFLFVFYLRSKRCLPLALHLWIEFKKPNARPRCKCLENMGTRKRCTACDQKNWKERERARGGIVWTVDDFDWFVDTYESSFAFLHSGETGRGQLELLIGSGQ